MAGVSRTRLTGIIEQHTPKQEKQTKQKTPSKFDQAASAALNKNPIPGGESILLSLFS